MAIIGISYLIILLRRESLEKREWFERVFLFSGKRKIRKRKPESKKGMFGKENQNTEKRKNDRMLCIS